MESTKKELLQELDEAFEKLKKDGLSVSREDIEKYFYLSDAVLSAGFVAMNLERQISSRIMEYYNNWHNYLNNLLSPNPSFMAGQTEFKLFSSEEDRKEIWRLIEVSMAFSSQNSLNGLNNDKKLSINFIEESTKVWREDFSQFLDKILKRVNDAWKK